jgi:hypothetical protein
MPQPGALQQPAAADLIRPDEADTISVSIRWRRSEPHYFRLEVNGKPLGEYDPMQEWPRAELDRAGRTLRSIAKIYDADSPVFISSSEMPESTPKIPS